MVYTCNFNTGELKAGGFRVWGQTGLHRTCPIKPNKQTKNQIKMCLNWLLESWKGIFLLWCLKGCKFEGKIEYAYISVFVGWVWFLSELLGLYSPLKLFSSNALWEINSSTIYMKVAFMSNLSKILGEGNLISIFQIMLHCTLVNIGLNN